ncbi:hypothetical protein FZEAL_6220 [Fusarium zealandicum]|uniref:PNPLA domain-containing protein n=1 Tax=Fusarium zealandicum TaxID=1053134 RepID=A0A8H4UJ01_9HYPO|nr:hypothetical protein FZEAL_6220 [Fusarium zealandicum]
MFSASELKDLPVVPADIRDSAEGIYTVPCRQKRELSADGPETVTQLWFQTQPLDTDTIQRIHSLKLVAESHDQGFTDDPLAGNWTWFEIVLLENKYSEEPRMKDGIQLVWVSHRNLFLSQEFGWEEGVKFEKDHDIFRLLEKGNVIAVRLCARFEAWKIKVRTGYLIIEIGAPVSRDSLGYGETKKTVLGIQEVFDEVNSSISPKSTPISTASQDLLFRAEMLVSAGDKPLRVLSLGMPSPVLVCSAFLTSIDGGGVRGIAALMHLDAVMLKLAPGKKPCEVFDIIGGTSTGGYEFLSILHISC